MSSFERDWTVHPSEIIRESLEERKMSVDQFAAAAGWSRETAQRLLDGDDRIGIRAAKALNSVIGVSTEFWLALQRGYDDDIAKGRRDARDEGSAAGGSAGPDQG